MTSTRTPECMSRNFQQDPGYDGYPFWVDDKTPPKSAVTQWHTRMRDFYWTLDQASLRLVRTADDEVTVELGHSMPFFDRYAVKIDGRDAAVGLKDETLVWKTQGGGQSPGGGPGG